MRVLVTRALDGARETAAALVALGHEAIVAPLLEIRYREDADITLDGVQAILATSANGIRALAKRTQRRDVPVFAVGDHTARTAVEHGFVFIKSAGGDADALARYVIGRLKPVDGVLFHPRGANTKGGLSELKSAGFDLRQEILYEATASETPTPAFVKALNDGVDTVLFFSPRSARLFVACTEAAGLSDLYKSIVAVCISQATANVLGAARFREIRVAKAPNQQSMLALF